MKKFISLVIILVLIVNCSILCTLQAFAHEAVLGVKYDICSGISGIDHIDERWYALVYPGKECYHISHEVQTIKYYFADNPETGYKWEDVPDGLGNEIKSSYAASMKKWNNVYFYSCDSAGNVIKNKVINIVEGTSTDNNLIIYPTNDVNASRAHTDKEQDSKETIETTESIDHYHISDWSMTINVEYFYVNDDHNAAEVEKMRDRTGAHEIGHILGLRDIDETPGCRNTQDEHHEELLMGYGTLISQRQANITYKDIAGVAITRGFHTDSDHKWLYNGLDDEGKHKLICSICNGVNAVDSLSGYTYNTYNACGGNHTLSSGNMMAVASYGTSDYYKCKYCRYVAPFSAIVPQNYSISQYSNDYHIYTNNVNGLNYTVMEAHNYSNGTCTVCGINHSHSYLYRYIDTSIHRCTCSCGYTTTEMHYVRRAEIIDNRYAKCVGCKRLLDLNQGNVSIIMGNNMLVSANGSYILSNGIVVLEDSDMEAYVNGTLVFYNPNDISDVE